MKKALPLFVFVLGTVSAAAQAVPDQNPAFAVSREKYMRMADSITKWHSTTVHDTYKAYDWYEAREERRTERRNNRYAIRLARAQRVDRGYYYDPYFDSYNYGGRFGFRNRRSFWW
ncbi:hypothetical protein [Flaviaesturariibacter amylovorans]|uniref:DUF4148 domain-containing protein n=1 Tax=Flaviaesturariibacter amylovorans TaxID=1084520 RepID=A0ABP8HG06_9BACT